MKKFKSAYTSSLFQRFQPPILHPTFSNTHTHTHPTLHKFGLRKHLRTENPSVWRTENRENPALLGDELLDGWSHHVLTPGLALVEPTLEVLLRVHRANVDLRGAVSWGVGAAESKANPMEFLAIEDCGITPQ